MVNVAPLMCREPPALQRRRSDSEALFGAAESLDGEAKDFRPHLRFHGGFDEIDMGLWKGVHCRIETLYKDSTGAMVSLDGEVWEIEGASMEDLPELAERVERLAEEKVPEGG